ncbi:MAG: LEA type 2 family protein [Leptospiraceae bacterium]|nr:LEA type 2 family protein [Leptospiraceae bacterium]
MNRRLAFTVIISLFVVTATTDCAMQRMRENLKNCEFDLDSVSVKKISFTSVELALDVGIKNPNSEQVILDELVFDLYGNDRKLGSGKHGETAIIPASERKVVTIDFQASLSEIGLGLLSTLKSGQATYRMDGTAYLDTFLGKVPIPFSIEKDLSAQN